jgi:hypothetical protein
MRGFSHYAAAGNLRNLLLHKGLILDKYILLKHLFDKSAQGVKRQNGCFENIFLFLVP